MTQRSTGTRHASFRLSTRKFNEFNREFGNAVREALDLERTRYLSMVKLNSPMASALVEYAVEERGRGIVAIDDRGTEQPVVHVCSGLNQHLLLALNYGWKQTARELYFRHIQILAFLAWGSSDVSGIPETSRRQLLRLEWEGVDESGVFVNMNAAHPHWNIDQWLAGYDPRISSLRTRLLTSDTPQEFGSPPTTVDLPPAVRWMRKVHLAAAARWADERWIGGEDRTMHASPPKSIAGLENWSLSAVRYIAQQFRAALDRA